MGRKKKSEVLGIPYSYVPTETWMPEVGGFQKLVPVGRFIRDLLIERGEMSIAQIHRAYKDEVVERYKEQGRRVLKRSLMTYNSFAVYFQCLKLLKFVEPSNHTEPSKPQQWYADFPSQVFYKLTDKGKEAPDDQWSDPRHTLYG